MSHDESTSPEEQSFGWALGRLMSRIEHALYDALWDRKGLIALTLAPASDVIGLLEEGALPKQVDRAIYDLGLAMGPYQMSDLAGLDVSWFIRQRQAATRPAHLRYSFLADRICELGRFGQKTGAGWYRYERGTRTPVPDPRITQLITDTSAELGQ